MKTVLFIVAEQWRGDALAPVLYDSLTDPRETRDPAYAKLQVEAAGRMLSWRMRDADKSLTHLCTTPDGLVDRRLEIAVR